MRVGSESGQSYTLSNGREWPPKWTVSQRGTRRQKQEWKKVRGRRKAEGPGAEESEDTRNTILKNTSCAGTGVQYSTVALLVREFKSAMEV
jgi:hypothetical protein